MRRAIRRLSLLIVTIGVFGGVLAHPLGNFSINHFVRIESGLASARIRYIVDLAEIPTFQELQKADLDRDGNFPEAELNAYLDQVTPDYLAGLKLTLDGAPVVLRLAGKSISKLPGAAGLSTLRIAYELTGESAVANATSRFRFDNANTADRPGWREIVVAPVSGVNVFDSTAYGGGLTDELRAYPEEMLMAPLNERFAEWSVTAGALPAGAKPLTLRDGKPVAAARDQFAELIAAPNLTPGVILIGLLIAFTLGGMHAMSPGHGKTVVGAYLVGSRGTVKHAAFLGATVTITHTIGVFALGLITLFASRYALPEKLYPVLSFVSGALVVAIGLSLLTKRLRALLGVAAHDHDHRLHDHHDHGPGGHTHLPPGADGSEISWRSLLALGVSGGIMPCPSALIVMLAAISMNRIGYGLVLIVAFSLGLACALTAVGLAFVYGGKLLTRVPASGKLMRALPAASAFVIAALGAAICYQALRQGGINLSDLWRAELETTNATSALGILVLGLGLGLRHALDTDHVAAVSAIVSERKHWFSSLLVGGLWGVGHTASLLLAGMAVILMKFDIGRYEKPLEFCVALMLIGLGANVLYKLARGGRIHFHKHSHAGHAHFHPHLHDNKPDPAHSHHGLKLGIRPLVIGMVHGLAGSAAVMFSVLMTIKGSTALAFAYIIIFGIGSIGGMMVMSLILSLPIHLTAGYFAKTNLAVRALAGCFSLGFGLFMVYEIGFLGGLLK
ncbi:MAG TPA: sulfite exporter TauE/SafE family protein [Blastocatellia bacterium]|nr:sulfite exporter TauE/SafE family protein [Blastocatellia bacterium]